MARTPLLLCTPLLAGLAAAQGPQFLFSTSGPEQTLSGSAGTVLRNLLPNEVVSVGFSPCPVISAEKWCPRTCYHTMAGDEDGDTNYWEPTLFGNVDALLAVPSPVGFGDNQRTVYWSPSIDMNVGVSGLPGLRRGDVGRIVRIAGNDGQVEHFIRAEHIQQALGMPITPIVVDVDAIAMDFGSGIFFSLDQDHIVNTGCNVTFVRDGDLIAIPAWAITWTTDMRVAAVVPGSAEVIFTEAQMDLMVQNAAVTDRNGACVNQIVDLEALEIDWSGPVIVIPGCTGLVTFVPSFLFTGETLTGASVLTTAGGGTIFNAGCGPLGTTCGNGPTFGFQMGLQPPSTIQGVASYVDALTWSWHCRFVFEPKQHVIAVNTPAVIDIASPGPLTWVFVGFAPWFPNAVAQSFPFPPNPCFPDVYNVFNIGLTGTAGGFGTYVSPPIPWPVKLLWQGVAIDPNNQIVISTPATVEVF